MEKNKKIRIEKTIFTGLAIFLIIASISILFNPFKQEERAITGYAVSNIFFTIQDTVSTLGFVARESSDIESLDYEVESTILLPSGEFTEDNYTVTIPYLGIEVIIPPQCSDNIDNDGDGLIDMADPGCSSSDDNDEYNEPEPEPQPSPPGPSGGVWSANIGYCYEDFECDPWSECQPDGTQTRTCRPLGVCSEAYRTQIVDKKWVEPETERSCEYKAPEPEPKPSPKKFEFIVKPKIEKKYKPGDNMILHTYINNPTNKNFENLEIEYNINEGTERTQYVEYEGIFDVSPNSEYYKHIDHSLRGYSKTKYIIHATLYSNGEKIAESYHDLDLS